MSARASRGIVVSLMGIGFGAGHAAADEGMWLLTRPPVEQLEARYGFKPSKEWLEHIRRSCVSMGASASLVSRDGLVMTNHHVGRRQLEKLSTAERNLLETGFVARTRAEELECPDMEVNVLWEITDVTERVMSSAPPDMDAAAANTARQKAIAAITKEAEESTGLNCRVVTLYHGGQHHLYCYKQYTEVRLVMAPEGDIAHFGGDTDNFEYPRFCLDMCFFRIYENGKPLITDDYLRWSPKGASDGELIFAAGNPGRTQRLYTVDHLKFLRDVSHPDGLASLWRREVQLLSFTARGLENARIAAGDLMGVQNGRKARTGMLAGLLDPAVLDAKVADEKKLRAAVAANPDYRAKWGGAWDELASALNSYRGWHRRYAALEGRMASGGSRLFSIGRQLVRLAAELPKPNGDRLREYRDSSLDSLYRRLYSSAPIYDDLEINRLESAFSHVAETFGADDPLTTKILAGKSPRDRAVELVRGTKLADVAVRKELAEGGTAAIAASTDPMIRLTYDLDPEARALRKRDEDELEGVEEEAYAKIGAARFAVLGDNVYPDATGSLRLAYGAVRGYEQDARKVPAFTTVAGLYDRYKEREGADPFKLPRSWLDRKDKLDPGTPVNFVCTADIVGGNSGSPVVNRKGEVVGLIFDGNLETLVWNTIYTDKQARAVAVDSRVIIESLRKIYDADHLADELLGE